MNESCPILKDKGITQAESGVRISLNDVEVLNQEAIEVCLDCQLKGKCVYDMERHGMSYRQLIEAKLKGEVK